MRDEGVVGTVGGLSGRQINSPGRPAAQLVHRDQISLPVLLLRGLAWKLHWQPDCWCHA